MRTIYITILLFTHIFSLEAQVIEAAFSANEYDIDHWFLHITEDDFIEANRQYGENQYRHWDISYLDADKYTLSGYLEMKRLGDLSYWDLFWNNEWLSIEMIHANDPRSWRIRHNDKIMTFRATNNLYNAWENRNNDDWQMYLPNEFDISEWFIDDRMGEELTFPMRIGLALLVIELRTFYLR